MGVSTITRKVNASGDVMNGDLEFNGAKGLKWKIGQNGTAQIKASGINQKLVVEAENGDKQNSLTLVESDGSIPILDELDMLAANNNSFVRVAGSVSVNGTFTLPSEDGSAVLCLCTPYGNAYCLAPNDNGTRNTGGFFGGYFYQIAVKRVGAVCTLTTCNRSSFNWTSHDIGNSGSTSLTAVLYAPYVNDATASAAVE